MGIFSFIWFLIPIVLIILGAWICKKQCDHEKKMKERNKKIDEIIERENKE